MWGPSIVHLCTRYRFGLCEHWTTLYTWAYIVGIYTHSFAQTDDTFILINNYFINLIFTIGTWDVKIYIFETFYLKTRLSNVDLVTYNMYLYILF